MRILLIFILSIHYIFASNLDVAKIKQQLNEQLNQIDSSAWWDFLQRFDIDHQRMAELILNSPYQLDLDLELIALDLFHQLQMIEDTLSRWHQAKKQNFPNERLKQLEQRLKLQIKIFIEKGIQADTQNFRRFFLHLTAWNKTQEDMNVISQFQPESNLDTITENLPFSLQLDTEKVKLILDRQFALNPKSQQSEEQSKEKALAPMIPSTNNVQVVIRVRPLTENYQ